MQATIIAVEDENFKFIKKDEPEQIDDSRVSSANNDDDVLVGRTWYKWLGEYYTPEEYDARMKQRDEAEEERKQASIERLKAKKIAETPVQPEPPKRREATLNNPSGHEWFNGTSWGVK